MSAFKGRGRLLLVAMPVGLAVALLAAFLPAGGDVPSQDTTRPESTRRAGSGWTQSPSESFRLAQAAVGLAEGDAVVAPVETSATMPTPTLTVYQCAPGNAPAVAAQLEQQFQGNPNVRVVPDGRTSQVLVMAPPEVQSQIAGRLREARPTGAVAAPASPAPAVSPPAFPAAPLPQGPSSQNIQLWHTTGAQFEAALVRVLGDRLTPSISSIPGESAYQLSLSNGGRLRISIDRPLNRVKIEGVGDALVSAGQLIHALDSPESSVERSMHLVALSGKRSADVRRVVDAIRSSQSAQASGPGGASTPGGQNPWRLAMTSQAADQASSAPAAPAAADATPGTTPPGEPAQAGPGVGAVTAPEGLGGEGGMIGSVQIEILPGDILVIRGHERDVQAVVKLIEQIEQISEPPAIKVYHLEHAHCASLATLLNALYEDVYSARQGKVSITALGKPNAVLLIGQQESVDTVVDLIKRLDRPVPASTQFEVFRLKSTPADDAKETLDEFFEDRYEDDEAGLGIRVLVTADFRTNSLLVWASPRDLSEVAAIIARLDGDDSESFNTVQIFKLKNSLAEDLAPVLQDAITGQMYGQRTGQRTLVQGSGTGERFERKSVRLQFVTVDENGQTRFNSGILTDAQVTADVRANALIVTASADSMPLIAALIWELDRLPTAEALVKVFTVIHGDASNLLEMLDDLFGAQTQGADLAVRTGATGEDSSLVFLRFAVDIRTNSIIATGSTGDLEVVEGILATLDSSDLRQRETKVMQLKNAAALNVSEAVNAFLETELEAQQPVEGLLSSIEQIDREVVIVPEEITNSLIISATERYFTRIIDLVEQLDARPPMVLIQVLIAAVQLNETDEFGIELGLQDSLLFDRSIAGVPGFLFNSISALGNDTTVPGSNLVGTQGITNLSLGRSNNELGYGGLVISASSESVSVLLRALQEDRRLEVLGRPQIMTIDMVPARIHVGERVRIPSGTSTTQFGTVNLDTQEEEVGLQLLVTPRVSPDGQVIMEIVTSRSQLGPEADGTVISIAADGTSFRSPRIEIVEAETTVIAMDGQTVILGGLITKDRSETHRQVPWLGDIPVLGNLFRFDSVQEVKTELLIILTPHIIESADDVEVAKQVEAARMEWCYGDVLEVHGDIFDRTGQTPVIYPDMDPHGQGFLRPSEDSPFIMESLPADSAGEQPFPARPMPLLGEQGAATSGRTSGAAGLGEERRRGFGTWLSSSAARRGSPDPAAAQPEPLRTSLTSGVEQADYELRFRQSREPATGNWSLR